MFCCLYKWVDTGRDQMKLYLFESNTCAAAILAFTAGILGCGSNTAIEDGPDTNQHDPGEALTYVEVEGGEYPYCTEPEASVDLDGDGWGQQVISQEEEICVVEMGDMDPNAPTVEKLDIAESLVNDNATETTRAVYSYLKSVFGKQVLSGQQDLTWKDSTDMFQRVVNDTGLAPAIMGYDFMNYTVADGQGWSGLTQTEEAIAHWELGGLVTFNWHWRDPSGETLEFYTESTGFRIPMDGDQLDRESEAFAQMEADVDRIAQELKALQDADVPVLWRPLHEASGGWFWWGATRDDSVQPANAQIALWKYLYDRLTNHHELNNLIWVWNGASADWYPGDRYVDIVGEDIYGDAQDYGSKLPKFNEAVEYPDSEKKMVALTENGTIPHPDNIKEDGAWWLYFVTWNDGDSEEGVTNSSNFWTGEYYNEDAHKVEVYNHELVITLDELPDFYSEH